MAGYCHDPTLIRQVPVLRAAYSDRTAWLLAEIARLVYEKLPAEIRVDELVRRILESARSQRRQAVVRALVAPATSASPAPVPPAPSAVPGPVTTPSSPRSAHPSTGS